MRSYDGMKKVSNPTVYKRLRRRYICSKTGKCHFCPPHGGMDNSTFHGAKFRERERLKKEKAKKFSRDSIRDIES